MESNLEDKATKHFKEQSDIDLFERLLNMKKAR